MTKQITETLLHCESRKQAEGVLAMRRASIFEGTYRPRSTARPVTVAQFVEKFLDVRKGELLAWGSYAGALRNHIVRLLGKRFLFDVKTGDCEDYRRIRTGEGAAPATIRNELRYFQAVFAESRKRGLTMHDPVSDVRFKGIDNARTRLPSTIEIGKMLDAARLEPPESWMRPVLFTLVCTGMRISSVLRLKWTDINFAEMCIEAVQKGNRRIRPPMAKILAEELELWRPWSIALDLERGNGWVFPSSRGDGHLTQTTVQRAWAGLLDRAGVQGITRHDMRRFVVTTMRSMGADNKAIGALSGHETGSMIDRYDRGAHERAAILVERVIDLKAISNDEKSSNSQVKTNTKIVIEST